MADNLRIVLFGAPAAGKSSLIGALAQAGQGQGAQLGGQFVDVGGGMAELHSQTYQKGPAPTQDELRDYVFTLEPSADSKAAATTATITDCSGQAAQAIMSAATDLPADSPLAQALLQADALILLVDASASVDRPVAALGKFLRLFQNVRGQRADIAGLPVYLVLSKCDTFAKPTDTYKQWTQKIDDNKHKLQQHFQKLLKDQAGAPFGKVQLHVEATAVKQPVLADRPAQPEPFGVAELFRAGLGAARAYQHHREHTAGRLSVVVMGMVGLIAGLGLLAGVLYLIRPSTELTALENRLQVVLPGSTAADRLREPLDERLQELTKIQESTQFAQLPPKLRTDVEQAREEMVLYQKFLKEFTAQVTDPRLATRDEDLDQIDKSLNAFALPAEYLSSWSETKLVRRMQQWRLDVEKLRAAAKDEIAWMQERMREIQELHKQTIAKGVPADARDAWLKSVQAYLDQEPRHKRSDRIAPTSSLTYDHVARLQRVERARKDWDGVKEKLKKLRTSIQDG